VSLLKRSREVGKNVFLKNIVLEKIRISDEKSQRIYFWN
jgi:hypothetical protein